MKVFKSIIAACLTLLVACGTTESEATPVPTINTEPVTYEDTGMQVIHAGYYEMTEDIYLNRGDTVDKVKKLIPDIRITTSYDYQGRRTEMTMEKRSETKLVFFRNETYTYDENGNVTAVRSYDASDLLVSVSEKKEDGWHTSDKDGVEITAEARDDYGNLTERKADEGQLIRTWCNKNGHVLKQETSDSSGTVTSIMECFYDANDHLPDDVCVKQADGTLVEEYYLARGNMRDNEIYSRYFRMSDDECAATVSDTYDEDSGLLKETVISTTEEETEIRIYAYA